MNTDFLQSISCYPGIYNPALHQELWAKGVFTVQVHIFSTVSRLLFLLIPGDSAYCHSRAVPPKYFCISLPCLPQLTRQHIAAVADIQNVPFHTGHPTCRYIIILSRCPLQFQNTRFKHQKMLPIRPHLEAFWSSSHTRCFPDIRFNIILQFPFLYAGWKCSSKFDMHLLSPSQSVVAFRI
jgi:hypothetical protein